MNDSGDYPNDQAMMKNKTNKFVSHLPGTKTSQSGASYIPG